MTKWTITALALLLPLVASAVTYNVKGTVMKVRPEANSVVIAHEDIPGFMPAMTMPFRVQDPKEIEHLVAGSVVEFKFEVQESGSFAHDFVITGSTTVQSQQANGQSGTPSLREGDQVIELSLVNQEGQPIALRDDKRWTVMTFIFTRCPVPDFCPLMSSNFKQIQRSANASGLGNDLRLLSVTMDPKFDTSEVLKEYGKAVGADFDNWEFATASPAEIDRLTRAFRVFVQENGITLDHTLCTALISPEGKIVQIWRGNEWTSKEVLDELSARVSASADGVAAD